MKKLIRLISYSLVLLFILLTASVSFLVSTNAGLYTSLHIANWVVPGKVSVKKATGTLLSTWQLTQINYESNTLLITLDTLKANLQPSDLLRGRFTINEMQAGHLAIQHKTVKDIINEPNPAEDTQNQSLQLPISITIKELSVQRISLEQYDLANIHLQMNFDNSLWQINQLTLETFHSQFEFTGHISPNYPFPAEMKLTTKAPHSNGVNGELSLKGNWSDYAWQGFITAPFSLFTAGHIKEGKVIDGLAKWQAFTLPGHHKPPIRVSSGELRIDGNQTKLEFNLDTSLVKPTQTKIKAIGFYTPQKGEALLTFNPGQGTLSAAIQQTKGQLENKTTIKLNGYQLDLTPFHLPITQLSINGKASGSNFKNLIVSLEVKGFYNHQPLSLSLHKTTQHIKGEIALANNRIYFQGINPFPLELKGTLPSPQLLAPALTGLHTSINIKGKLTSLSNGHARLSVQSGSYANPTDSNMPPLAFNGGNYDVILSKQGLLVSGKLAIDPNKTLLTKIQLPGWSLQADNKKPQTISGQASLSLNSLDFLTQISPYILEADGNVKAQLNISGLLSNPELKGKIQLDNGRLKTTTSAHTFEPITATLNAGSNNWHLQALVNQQKTQLSLNGSGQFAPHLTGKITVFGKEFLVMDNTEYQIYVSPNIAINLLPEQIQITGNITIPKATIKPQTFSSTVTLSDDVVFADQQPEATESNPFNLDVQVTMGDDVHLMIEGLKSRIIGAVHLQKQSGGILTSSGQLSVVDGHYEAYGRKLDISQGELLFTGGSVLNPGINVRATRTFNTSGQALSGSNRLFDFGASNTQSLNFSNVTTVGIQVSGRVNKPKISLFSEPSNLQQSDILSMLLLGRPANQASGAGGELLLSAIADLGLNKGTEGTQLLSQLQNKLGLEFGMNSNETYNPQQEEVTSSRSLGIKKKFSERLSISYNIGIFDANSSIITITYLLNKFLSIQVNASDNGSGIDLTYTRSKD